MQDDRARSRQVELILEQVDALPTLSPVASRLMSLGSVEDVNVDEVVTLIESDPAMTATILGLCRKSDRGLGDKIDTVQRAVVLLGFEQVRSAALGVGVYELMAEQAEELDRTGRAPDEVDGLSRFDRVGIWKHSVATATCAELLCDLNPHLMVRGEQAFVAGLLHDLGKLALELVLPRAVSKVAENAERRASDFAPVARTVLGLDQHTAGRRLATKWGLPQPITDTIWLCGQPVRNLPDVEHKTLIGLITLSAAICRRNHLGWSGDFGSAPDVAMQTAELGISPSKVEALTETLVDRVVERCRVLRLDEETTPGMLLQSIASANQRLSAMNLSMQRQATLARRQASVLDAISNFQEDWDPQRTVVETLELIARSSASLLGEGFYAAVFQASADEPWQVHAFNGSGKLTRSCVAEPAGNRLSGGSLAALVGSSEISMAAMSVLPWLSDYLSEAPDLRTVRVLPICATSDGASAVLLHDRDISAALGKPERVAAVRGAWGAALQTAAAGEFSRRLGEQLAEAGRSISEMQTLLTERESMARLGEMTAGAAHEMNNPLTVIRGRGQLLADRLTEKRDRSDAHAICSASAHLSELITSLHLIASPPVPETSDAPMQVVLERAEALASDRAMGSLGTVSIAADADAFVRADRELLASALCEPIVNAWEARGGGDVVVKAQRDLIDGRIHLTVEDSGPGLSGKALRHAFDPFFSDKPAGRQTGLGLSRARRLIELQGGEIRLENRSGQPGVRVTVRMPSGEPVEIGPRGGSGRSRGSGSHELAPGSADRQGAAA